MKNLLLFLAALGMLLASYCPGNAAARKVLVEVCTSTTCSPCYAPDVYYFQQWLPNYGGNESVVTLAYHVWWPSPGNDPMYLANTAPVQARMTYYNNIGSNGYVPRAYIDGFIDGTSNYTSWPGAIDGRWLDFSPISITLTGSRNGTTLNMNAAIYAEQAVNSSTWRVRWAMVESEIPEPQNSPSGYVPFTHHYVHRGMYPDANGSPITISQGQTVNFPMTITMNGAWNPDNCRVIVFVQNDTDHKVQNAEYVDVSTLTGVGDPVNGIPTTFAISQNYPNPFNPTTMIDYAVREQSFVGIKVYNLLGQEVKDLVSEEKGAGVYTVAWDGRDNFGKEIPSGMYMYKMFAGSFSQTRKMMLLK
jgi:hypothetical protein